MSGRFGELLLILLIILILFGAGKLPHVMGEMGKGIRAFKNSIGKKDNSEKDDKNS